LWSKRFREQKLGYNDQNIALILCKTKLDQIYCYSNWELWPIADQRLFGGNFWQPYRGSWSVGELPDAFGTMDGAMIGNPRLDIQFSTSPVWEGFACRYYNQEN